MKWKISPKQLDFHRFFLRLWAIAGAVSVRTKILGIVLGLVLILWLGITLQVRSALSQSMNHNLQEQSVSITRDLAARATDLILLNDIYALHQLLTETQTNYPDVRYAFILNSQGQVLSHTFGDKFPLGLLEINQAQPQEHHHTVLINTNDGYVWDTAVPIFNGRSGIARIGLSDESIRQAIRTVTGQLLLTTILVSVAAITAATFLTWILTRPILELVGATRRVAAGDFSHRVKRWADDEIGDLADAFNQMTVELSRLDELRRERELLRRQLLDKVITTQEEERRRIARELHDSTSQALTSLMVSLRMLESTDTDTSTSVQVRELREVVAQILDEVHNLAKQLRPQVLDDLGLPAALERLVSEWQHRHALPVDLLIHLGEQRLSDAAEIALYRIVQETLTNVARHANAHSVSVLVERRNEQVVVVVEDDGIGFDSNLPGKWESEPHLGLLGMRERAELLGGKLTVESTPQAGTSIFVQIPINSHTAT